MIKTLIYTSLAFSLLFWGSDLADSAPVAWRVLHFTAIFFTVAVFEIGKKGIFLRLLRSAAFMLSVYGIAVFCKDESPARFLSNILTLGAP